MIGGENPTTPQELLGYLDELGFEHETFSPPAVFTVAEAKELRGSLVGAHTKNLFVRDKKGLMWLIVALEDRSIDLQQLARSLGHKRFSFGSSERLMSYLGVVSGAVTPFALINDLTRVVRIALDLGLGGFDTWNFHPLDNAMTTSIRSEDMLQFLVAIEHAPTWIDLAGKT